MKIHTLTLHTFATKFTIDCPVTTYIVTVELGLKLGDIRQYFARHCKFTVTSVFVFFGTCSLQVFEKHLGFLEQLKYVQL
jgi:hypothetical protein